MSAARRLRFPFSPVADATQAFTERLRARPEKDGRKSLQDSHGAGPFSELVGRAVRIASIDLDRDPWWLYFRRRR